MRAAPSTRRRALRPGVGALRGGPGAVQVGLEPPQAAVLPDTPQVRTLLQALASAGITTSGAPDGDAPGAPGDGPAPVLRTLEHAGLLVDPDQLARDRARHGAAAEAAYARLGDEASQVLAHRSSARIRVEPGAGPHPAAGTDGSRIASETAALLAQAGVGLSAEAGPPPDVTVLVSAGVLPRGRTDDLVRLGRAHLVVEGLGGVLRVGPFVVPGLTACLRCLDAHATDRDPRRPLLLDQLSSAARAAVPADPVLATLAVAWAAGDVVRFVDGERPTTWSARVDLDGDDVPTPVPYERHPGCGCAWDEVP